MKLFKKEETLGEKLRSPEETTKAQQLAKLLEFPEFGLTHFLKKDCPNEKNCFSVSVGDKTLAHQLCAVCSMLQQLIIELKTQHEHT
jgi:hypothetical protein